MRILPINTHSYYGVAIRISNLKNKIMKTFIKMQLAAYAYSDKPDS